MNKLFAVCLIAIFAGYAIQASAQEKQNLRLVQTIPLPGVTGRLDHMGVDLEKKRLFVAAVANNTLEVVDLTGGKVIKSLAGFKDTQDALFLGGEFNKLYVSSLDGHVRVFQGESFWLVRDFKIEPDPNRLFFDPATKLIYFGYGGQNAGFDAYERVGILQPKPAAGYDQLVADMIAPTPRPGHLAEMAMDDNGILLACDSRADRIYQFDTRKRELIKSWPARGDGARRHGARPDPAPPICRHEDSTGDDCLRQLVWQGNSKPAGAGNNGWGALRRQPQARLHDRWTLVRDAGRIARLGLCLPAERSRPLRPDLQNQDQTRFGHFALRTATQSFLCRVSGARRSSSRNIGV
jgi:hypothetical protein